MFWYHTNKSLKFDSRAASLGAGVTPFTPSLKLIPLHSSSVHSSCGPFNDPSCRISSASESLSTQEFDAEMDLGRRYRDGPPSVRRQDKQAGLLQRSGHRKPLLFSSMHLSLIVLFLIMTRHAPLCSEGEWLSIIITRALFVLLMHLLPFPFRPRVIAPIHQRARAESSD